MSPPFGCQESPLWLNVKENVGVSGLTATLIYLPDKASLGCRKTITDMKEQFGKSI
jgi:hypothetical protein